MGKSEKRSKKKKKTLNENQINKKQNSGFFAFTFLLHTSLSRKQKAVLGASSARTRNQTRTRQRGCKFIRRELEK